MADKVISDSQPLRPRNILAETVTKVADKYPVLFGELFKVQNIAWQDDGLLYVLNIIQTENIALDFGFLKISGD